MEDFAQALMGFLCLQKNFSGTNRFSFHTYFTHTKRSKQKNCKKNLFLNGNLSALNIFSSDFFF